MSKTTGSISLAARHLAGAVVFTLLGGCAGDGLLLPSDGAPAELRMVSGNQQSAPAGDPVPHPLIVEALTLPAGRCGGRPSSSSWSIPEAARTWLRRMRKPTRTVALGLR
jgi:hypothetical protein